MISQWKQMKYFCRLPELTGELYGVQRTSSSISWYQRNIPPVKTAHTARDRTMVSLGQCEINFPHLIKFFNSSISTIGAHL